MKISNEERARILSAYIGANVQLYSMKDVTSCKLWGVTLDKFLYQLRYKPHEGASINWGDLSACTILLRPLSAMSNEHVAVVAAILQTTTETAKYFIDIFLEGNDGILSQYAGFEVRTVLHKLMELGYNCGFGPYSPEQLIEAGIASQTTHP